MRVFLPLLLSVFLIPSFSGAGNVSVVEQSSLALVSADRTSTLDRNNYVLNELNYSNCLLVHFHASRLGRAGNLQTSTVSVHLADVNLDRSVVEQRIHSDLVTLELSEVAFKELVVAFSNFRSRFDKLHSGFLQEAMALGLEGSRPYSFAKEQADRKLADEILSGQLGIVFSRTHYKTEELGKYKEIGIADEPFSQQVVTRPGFGERLINFLQSEKAAKKCS